MICHCRAYEQLCSQVSNDKWAYESSSSCKYKKYIKIQKSLDTIDNAPTHPAIQFFFRKISKVINHKYLYMFLYNNVGPTVAYIYSLLLYEPYANVSSMFDENLPGRSEFHSNHRVNLSTPRYCQSATFEPLAFCFYPLLFTEKRV